MAKKSKRENEGEIMQDPLSVLFPQMKDKFMEIKENELHLLQRDADSIIHLHTRGFIDNMQALDICHKLLEKVGMMVI